MGHTKVPTQPEMTMELKTRSKKAVRWSTITVYEFGVGIGGSSVPKHGGPAIGLAKTPRYVWKTTVQDTLCSCSHTSLISPYSSSADVCQCHASPHEEKRSPRSKRVRWFKPFERIKLLEKAGYSEKKIYKMLMESSDIAMSRRLSLRVPRTRSIKRKD